MTIVLVYARPPIPGRTKTRLARSVGDEAAAALHAAFLEDTLRRAGSLPNARVRLDVTEPHEALDALATRHRVELVVQVDGDLGARMEASIAAALRDASRVLLLGSDAPTTTLAVLQQAERALDRVDAALAPTDDGGYALLGARRPVVFDGVRWSTENALADTERSFDAHGIRHVRTEPTHDVDDEAGLARLVDASRRAPALAPSTHACLVRLGLLRF